MEVLVASEDRPSMSADLLRQRRNLLTISLILVAIHLAGASFKDEISILGAGIKFAHPDRLLWGAWVLWAYFMLRYGQYLFDVRDLGIQTSMGDWIASKHQSTQSLNQHRHFPPSVTWNSPIKWHLEDGLYIDGRWEIRPVPITLWTKTIWTVRAFVSTAIRTPRITDYLLPFVVGILPVLLVVWDFFTTFFAVSFQNQVN